MLLILLVVEKFPLAPMRLLYFQSFVTFLKRCLCLLHFVRDVYISNRLASYREKTMTTKMMFPKLYGHALVRVHGSLREWIFLESGALAFYLTKMARCFAFSDSDLEEQHHHYSPRTGAHLLYCSGSEGSCPLAAAVLSLGWDGGEGLWGHSPARSLQQPQEEAAGRWGHRQTEPSGPCIALTVSPQGRMRCWARSSQPIARPQREQVCWTYLTATPAVLPCAPTCSPRACCLRLQCSFGRGIPGTA